MTRRVRAAGALLLTVLGLMLLTPGTAAAYPPVDVVHTERVQAGPYGLTVGFSTWPLRAMRSLDFTFVPDGGIEGKSGTLTETNPSGRQSRRPQPLSRHPRKLEVWGLDVRSLNAPGNWTFRFVIDGPQGQGVGELTKLTVLEQPGPPLALSWSISTLPLLGLVTFLVVAARRTRPVRSAPDP
jgi:hypothetical protein